MDHVGARSEQICEGKQAGNVPAGQLHENLQPGECLADQAACARAAELGDQTAQHPDVVAALEGWGQYHCPTPDLTQRELELARAISRVDVDENQPGAGRRKHREHPLRVARRPDAEAITRLESAGGKPASEALGPAPFGSSPA